MDKNKQKIVEDNYELVEPSIGDVFELIDAFGNENEKVNVNLLLLSKSLLKNGNKITINEAHSIPAKLGAKLMKQALEQFQEVTKDEDIKEGK